MASILTNPTLADVIGRMDSQGNITKVAELMSANTDFFDDLTYEQANGVVSHRTTVRSGLPEVAWRQLYKGVQPSKSTVTTVDEPIGMLEGRSVIDSKLLALNGNDAAWRLSEDSAFLQSMRKKVAENLFGINAPEAEGFTGFPQRFAALDAENAQNIIGAGGSGNTNTSIWLVVWSPQTVTAVYPKGSTAGLQARDLGEDTIYDDAGRPFQANSTLFQWDMGLSVRDWRYVVRIANIDTKALTETAATGANLLSLMARACRRIEDLTAGRAAFYMNRDTAEILDLQHVNQIKNSTLTFEDAGGRQVTKFRGIPVRIVDAISNAEPAVK